MDLWLFKKVVRALLDGKEPDFSKLRARGDWERMVVGMEVMLLDRDASKLLANELDAEVRIQSGDELSVIAADPETFTKRIKGACAYLALVEEGAPPKRFMIKPFDPPFEYDV